MGRWSNWEEGNNGISARIWSSGKDTYPNNFKCKVQIKDADGKVHDRVGKGKFIGNFSPIWVNWKGKSQQLTEILRG